MPAAATATALVSVLLRLVVLLLPELLSVVVGGTVGLVIVWRRPVTVMLLFLFVFLVVAALDAFTFVVLLDSFNIKPAIRYCYWIHWAISFKFD